MSNCDYPNENENENSNCSIPHTFVTHINNVSCFSMEYFGSQNITKLGQKTINKNIDTYIYGISKFAKIKLYTYNKNICIFGDLHGITKNIQVDKKYVYTPISLLNTLSLYNYDLFLEIPINFNIDKCNSKNLIYYTYHIMKNKTRIVPIDIRHSMDSYDEYYRLFQFIEWFIKSDNKSNYNEIIEKWKIKLDSIDCKLFFINFFKLNIITNLINKSIDITLSNKIISIGIEYINNNIPLQNDSFENKMNKLFYILVFLVDIYTCLNIFLHNTNKNIIIYIGAAHINNIIYIIEQLNINKEITVKQSKNIYDENIIKNFCLI